METEKSKATKAANEKMTRATFIGMLEAAGFSAGEENSAEKKTYGEKANFISLKSFYKKEVVDAKISSDSDIAEKAVALPGELKTKRLTPEQRLRFAGKAVAMIAKSKIKHNGKFFLAGDVIKLDGESAKELFLASAASYKNEEDEKEAREILNMLKEEDEEELKNLRTVAEKHAPRDLL